MPGAAPDYARLKPLGADSVVEFVIEEYGIRAEKGVPQTWVSGSGRMFRLSDDPSTLSGNARPFKDQMVAVLDAVSVRLARQLSPGATPPGTKELQTPADAKTPAVAGAQPGTVTVTGTDWSS